jgi:predicted LPLAT superfamily acyltransferase
MQLLLWGASVYFLLFAQDVRRGSRQYLEHLCASPEGRAALHRPPNIFSVLRHIHSFAVSVNDRMLTWGGELQGFEIEHDGSGEIFELVRNRRGALLLGAHLGSFELLWFLSREYDLAINVVVFYENAERVNEFFDALDSDVHLRAIGVDPTSVQASFQIKACIDRGEIVVILADRSEIGEHSRSSPVTFLGAPAKFPLGPFLLAGALECPVFLALCVRTGESRYRTVLKHLRPAVRIPRHEREKRAQELLEQYSGILESYCHQFPFEWFNFFEFWDKMPENRS